MNSRHFSFKGGCRSGPGAMLSAAICKGIELGRCKNNRLNEMKRKKSRYKYYKK